VIRNAFRPSRIRSPDFRRVRIAANVHESGDLRQQAVTHEHMVERLCATVEHVGRPLIGRPEVHQVDQIGVERIAVERGGECLQRREVLNFLHADDGGQETQPWTPARDSGSRRE